MNTTHGLWHVCRSARNSAAFTLQVNIQAKQIWEFSLSFLNILLDFSGCLTVTVICMQHLQLQISLQYYSDDPTRNHSAGFPRCFVKRNGFECCKQQNSLSEIRWKLCCTHLSLRCDPDRQRAIVPPLIHKLSLIVRLLLTGGCVEPHVVDYAMILNVAAYGRESLSVACTHYS